MGSYGYINTYLKPNPIRRHVSSLGSATFSDGLIVSSPVATISDSVIYSPTSTVVLSPYNYTTSPTTLDKKRLKEKQKYIDISISSPIYIPPSVSYIDVGSNPD